jgi:ribonuclease HII
MPAPPETITEARAMLARADRVDLPRLIRRFSRDPRAGVRALAAAAGARLARRQAEEERLQRLMARQLALEALGVGVVAGIDEVGRGALAGPVTACAVVLAADCSIDGLDDSKRLSRERRLHVADAVRTRSLAFCVAHVGPAEIDRWGIGPATRMAWAEALDGLSLQIDHVLVDGNDPGALRIPTTAVVKGDSSVACIAAASVVAKVVRDALMVACAADHPGYGLDVNFGYGTPEHLDALSQRGPSPIHRLSFAPCATQDRLF